MLLPQLLDVLDHVLDSWQYDPFRYVGQAVAPQPQEVNMRRYLTVPLGLIFVISANFDTVPVLNFCLISVMGTISAKPLPTSLSSSLEPLLGHHKLTCSSLHPAVVPRSTAVPRRSHTPPGGKPRLTWESVPPCPTVPQTEPVGYVFLRVLAELLPGLPQLSLRGDLNWYLPFKSTSVGVVAFIMLFSLVTTRPAPGGPTRTSLTHRFLLLPRPAACP